MNRDAGQPATTFAIRPGATNSIIDVPGLRVGHHHRKGDGWLTGTTVVLPPSGGAVGGVDVRGGGPGTRETDLLDPRNMVERVHGIALTGGSAFGLAAADGVMSALEAAGEGFPVGPDARVPIVPAAVIFDLGRGGDAAARPTAQFGAAVVTDALEGEPTCAQGCVGAGVGAVSGGLKGGVGSASAVLPDGTTVAALVVVNAVGSCVDPDTGELYGARHGLGSEFAHLTQPDAGELAAAAERAAQVAGPQAPPLATTIGVIATDATLSKAQCAKVSGIGHDGLARAIRPVHTMLDGDTLFTLATGAREPAQGDQERIAAFQGLLEAAGDCVTRAVVHAMLAAETTTTALGPVRSYAHAFPSAVEG